MLKRTSASSEPDVDKSMNVVWKRLFPEGVLQSRSHWHTQRLVGLEVVFQADELSTRPAYTDERVDLQGGYQPAPYSPWLTSHQG
jgi:hypothetical protein